MSTLAFRMPNLRGPTPAGGQGREKFFSRKIAHNPLKTLISDERIQGNPSFSNPLLRSVPKTKEPRPRKSKSSAFKAALRSFPQSPRDPPPTTGSARTWTIAVASAKRRRQPGSQSSAATIRLSGGKIVQATP
jgi:hypothetical protein